MFRSADWGQSVLLSHPGIVDLLVILQRAVRTSGSLARGGSGRMRCGTIFSPLVGRRYRSSRRSRWARTKFNWRRSQAQESRYDRILQSGRTKQAHQPLAVTIKMKEHNKMTNADAITCVFIDIGGVLLTDGWDHHARRRAAKAFQIDYAEMSQRHHQAFEVYEEGRLRLEEYLELVVFNKKRSFTKYQFRRFMFAQSKPYPKMIDLVAQLRIRRGLKIVAVSNEARELNAFRIHKFKLNEIIESFISSSFVHLRKPNAEIFRLALEVTQVPAYEVLYIENTPMFVEIAKSLGIRSILHKNFKSTSAKLASFGLYGLGKRKIQNMDNWSDVE